MKVNVFFVTTIATRFEENRQVNFYRSWDAVRGVALDQTTDHADYVQVGQTIVKCDRKLWSGLSKCGMSHLEFWKEYLVWSPCNM